MSLPFSVSSYAGAYNSSFAGLMSLLLNPNASCACGRCGVQTPANPLDLLEKEVAEKLEDPQKANIIRVTYQESQSDLKAAWPEFDSKEFQDWLIEMSKYLGSLAVDHVDLALRTFSADFQRKFREPQGYKERIDALTLFFSKLQNKWGRVFESELVASQAQQKQLSQAQIGQEIQKVVVVLLRKCGNGHVTASKGIEQFLTKRGYQVKLVDGGEFDHAQTILQLGTVSIFCSQGVELLRGRVKALHPDLIINTVAHHNRWTQLAYDLNTPELVVHTDYELNNFVLQDSNCNKPYAFDNSTLIKYCIPHEEEDGNLLTVKSRLSESRFNAIVHKTGFPVREAFVREERPEAIAALRSELGIRSEERVILILGHREDSAKMLELIKLITASGDSFVTPLHIVAVCGDDASVYSQVEQAVKSMPTHAHIRIKQERYLSEEELAKYMKIVSRSSGLGGVMISKSGGSTTAEATAMGVFTLSLQTKASEACNTHYTKEHELGEALIMSQFPSQLIQILKWEGSPDKVYKSPLDWRNNLEGLVRQKIQESALAREGQFRFTTGNIVS